MLQRCTNPKCPDYHRYGGRGINVCRRWRKFENFLRDMGEPPSDRHQIDRINNDMGYRSSNCRWVTRRTNGRNTRRNRLLTHKGRSQRLAAWAKETGINVGTIHSRLKAGWPVERALTKPGRNERGGERVMNRSVLLTGVNGQDGSFLAELLLEKGYRAHGLIRRSSTVTTERIAHLIGRPDFELIAGDVTDATGLLRIIKRIQPDEVYNLAAQSCVGTSFETPAATFEVNALGTLNVLEAIRAESPGSRFYQASTSELFGNSPPPQHEHTPMIPRSPYAVAKLAAHSLVRLYREAYGIFACAGILFNHESPRRGAEFVTRKITMYVARLAMAMENNAGDPPSNWPKLNLGNLDAKRDWSFAGDVVRGMWLMLQQDQPDDFVLASGESHSVREFLELAFKPLGLDYRDFVRIDPAFFRPAEVNYLCGDATKAREVIGWSPQVSFEELVTRMVESDVARERDCRGLRFAS